MYKPNKIQCKNDKVKYMNKSIKRHLNFLNC
nr:MAG TPA: hypothetical protein [Caudoviricetes sp.]